MSVTVKGKEVRDQDKEESRYAGEERAVGKSGVKKTLPYHMWQSLIKIDTHWGAGSHEGQAKRTTILSLSLLLNPFSPSRTSRTSECGGGLATLGGVFIKDEAVKDKAEDWVRDKAKSGHKYGGKQRLLCAGCGESPWAKWGTTWRHCPDPVVVYPHPGPHWCYKGDCRKVGEAKMSAMKAAAELDVAQQTRSRCVPITFHGCWLALALALFRFPCFSTFPRFPSLSTRRVLPIAHGSA